MFVKTMGTHVCGGNVQGNTQWLVQWGIIKNYIANNIWRFTVDNIVYIMHAKCKNNCTPAIVL